MDRPASSGERLSGSLDRARILLATALGLGPEALPDDVSPRTCKAWDSLAHVRIALAIETERGTPLSAEEILGLAGLEDIAALLT